MAFIDALAEASGGEGVNIGRSLTASVVRAGLGEGLSGQAILQGMRDAGIGIRTQSFYQLLGEVRASSALADQWAGAALDQMPGEDMIASWQGGQADKFLNRVYMYVRTNVGGELSVERRGVSILTDTLITPGDALSLAQSLYEENADSDNYADEQFLGAEFGGVYHQTGA